MGVFAQLTTTTSDVLNGVSTSVNVVTKGISTVAIGIDVLESYALDIKADQLDSAAVRKEERRRALKLEASRNATRLDESIASEMYSTPQRKALFDSHYARISALFD